LITELGYKSNLELLDSAKIAVLVASVIAAAIAAVTLLSRGRSYAAMALTEDADRDNDGIPDVYQQGDDQAGPPAR
jgi:NhaA family Na+:H+ antiporter